MHFNGKCNERMEIGFIYFRKVHFTKEVGSFVRKSLCSLYKEAHSRDNGRPVSFNINDAPGMHTESAEFQKPPIDTH